MRAYTLKKNVLVHDSPPHPVCISDRELLGDLHLAGKKIMIYFNDFSI
jgi:hypothetical protein